MIACKYMEVVRVLVELGNLYEILGETWKSKAYLTAADNVPPGLSLANVDEYLAAGISGVGKTISGVIRAALAGDLSLVESLRAEPKVVTYRIFRGIIGAGDVAIRNWIEAGATDLPSLRRLVGAGRVELTPAQQVGLRYHHELIRRIPRAAVRAVVDSFGFLAGTTYEIAGSYRRGLPAVGDIDVVIKSSNADRAQAEIPLRADFVAWISRGVERSSFVLRPANLHAIQVDLLFLRPAHYCSGLLYFTGSWEFNEAMRRCAKKKGWRLNQHGLLIGDKLYSAKSEQAIFAKLGLPWIEPRGRTAAAINC
jgi:DNA polymerase/3'-5' exonuclease PolX